MVDATVDNKPVSIVLETGQSTTVPSNETWRLRVFLGNRDTTFLGIDGTTVMGSGSSTANTNSGGMEITLEGGQTIAEARGDPKSVIFVTGFVVST